MLVAGRQALCVLVLAIAAANAEDEPPQTTDTLQVGVIRWDAWTEWEKYKRFLYPPQWHYRLPFYARVNDGGTVEIRGDRMEVMNREIAYASDAGIDYWAWCWYDPTTSEAAENHMNDALELYRKSERRSLVNYCLIGPGYFATVHWEDTVKRFVAMFKEPNYQKVLGDRPLFYYFAAEEAVPHFGSREKAQSAIKELREESMAQGAGEPYIVALSFWPDKGAQALAAVGFDAIGAYCNPPGAENRALEYSELTGLNRWFWNACKETGLPVVPPVNAGWDPRPRRALEQVSNEGNWCPEVDPRELAAHVADAARWVRDNQEACEAKTLLIYAWNEFDEGGWICPTLSEGTARLDAIRKALGPESSANEHQEDNTP